MLGIYESRWTVWWKRLGHEPIGLRQIRRLGPSADNSD
jgi:hypothetical protein